MHLVAGALCRTERGEHSERRKSTRKNAARRTFVKIDYVFIVNDTAAQAVLGASSLLQRNDRLRRRQPSREGDQKEDTS